MSIEDIIGPSTKDPKQEQPGGGNEEGNERHTNVVRDQFKQIILFSVAKETMAFAILLAFLHGAKDIRAMCMHSSAVIKALSFLVWLTLQSPILLLTCTICRFGRYDRIYQNQNLILISLITISCLLLIVTSFIHIVRGNEGENEQFVVVMDQLEQIKSFLVENLTMVFIIRKLSLTGAQYIIATHSSTVFNAYEILIWLTFSAGISLLFYTFFLFLRSHRINRNHKKNLISAITISCVLLIGTNFFSIALLNNGSAGISATVILVISIMCFIGYAATRNVSDNDSTDHEWYISYKREQEKAFKFSTTFSTMAITVQGSMIYASFKSPPLQAVQSFQLGPCLFFLISMVGIFVMMVTSIPFTLHHSSWRKNLSSFVRYSSTALSVLVGLSAALLTMQFFGSLVVGVFLLVVILIFVYFVQEHFSTSPSDPTSDRYVGMIMDSMPKLVSFNCGQLAAICTASVVISPQQYYMSLALMVCALFQLFAIESGLIWIVLMFEPQHGKIWASMVEIFYYVSLLAQIVTIPVTLFIVLSWPRELLAWA